MVYLLGSRLSSLPQTSLLSLALMLAAVLVAWRRTRSARDARHDEQMVTIEVPEDLGCGPSR